ncbi:HK97 family phage protein [Pseudomonas sp. StFLB209]|uniref:HK97-gp10 family putative phage morphogenesis protein n=1 Tax=Pseudomonas sp. StFLB209 TaxID=1028989 RepID=UPI0004F5F8D3|nr:HK97-gp10 family putative phage morphogenesis protein [Pseudomonas sp. StFLB209]BAP44763.1 HK97 family phage protein [Pseudomonas sp. StFLB209]
MAEISMNILGLGDLQADFERLAKATGERVLRDAVMAGARVVRDKARTSAPVRTRKLKKNIIASRAGQAHNQGAATAGIRVRRPTGKTTRALKRGSKPGKRLRTEYASPFYWKFLELGTSKLRARPFIRPAWDGSLPQIEGAVRTRLADAIDKVLIR